MPNANVFVLHFTTWFWMWLWKVSINVCYQNALVFVVGGDLLKKSLTVKQYWNATLHSKARNVERKMVRNPNKFTFLKAIWKRKEHWLHITKWLHISKSNGCLCVFYCKYLLRLGFDLYITPVTLSFINALNLKFRIHKPFNSFIFSKGMEYVVNSTNALTSCVNTSRKDTLNYSLRIN